MPSDALLPALQQILKAVEADLRARSDDADDPWAQGLRAQYEAARAVGRTAWTWSVWRDHEVSLAAVAWVLGTVFVRFCEDNGLLSRRMIAGPGSAMLDATEAENAFYAAHPAANARDWLREGFAELARFPATAGLVDRTHSPVWSAPLGADAAEELLAFWRSTDAQGALTWDLIDPAWDTRFLGDLYQELSAHAKKAYALLQTPDFVEEFILSRTLAPAIATLPIDQVTVIDPTCGSGHFLLGAFAMLLEARTLAAPAEDERVRIQAVLDAVAGVDINPFAVAIARFRLVTAAMRACGATSLASAPSFKPRVAVADSLLAGDSEAGKQGELDFGNFDELAAHRYAAEDVDEYEGILTRGQYQVVVGNPPYITAEDPALKDAYRARYDNCYREYALTVPFAELFFELAVKGDGDGAPAGWVGQITSNSFMKREFGSKVVENLLSGVDTRNPAELTEVIDTSGAYIPGHGTPTVILIGRRRRPSGDTVRAVLGVRGEPGQPSEPEKGLVWSQIVEHIDDEGRFDGEYVTVTPLPRATFATHPWSLTGGGAATLKAELDGQPVRLSHIAANIGYTGQTNADGFFLAPSDSWGRAGVEPEMHRQVVIGEVVRDFAIGASDHALFLYDTRGLIDISTKPGSLRRAWPWRTVTWNRATFNKVTYRAEGRSWWEWHQVALDRLRTPLSIAFAFVATHNHFVLDRGGKVFKQSAPVIKLPADATLADHLGLLAVLNSSVACFWLKQVCHASAGSPLGADGARVSAQGWDRVYQLNGTPLKEFPLPATLPAGYGRVLDDLAAQAAESTPDAYLAALPTAEPPTRSGLAAARSRWETTRAQMIAWQEELDWFTYRLYGLCDDDLTSVPQPDAAEGAPIPELPAVALGQRAFEIVLARRVAAGEESTEWFARHGSTPITDIPDDWPEAYRDVVARRIEAIESNPHIRLLERPEFKRRWQHDSWESMQTQALRGFVLDRLEARPVWFGGSGARTRSVAQIADAVRHDAQVQAGLDLLFGVDADRVAALGELLADEAVPFAAAWRYKPSGLVKRAEWEAVWELQRREDAGERVDIPVPPKYAQADFRKPSYWRARGKLDVPKERFISYPGAERAGDGTAVYGWAGWDHAEAAQALGAVIIDRADVGGWGSEQLVPLLAGLVELEPWLHQWHGEFDPEFGTSIADEITGLLESRLADARITRDDARAWRPPEVRRGRRATG